MLACLLVLPAQIVDVLEDIVHTVEYELTEERIINEYEAEVAKRSAWNPVTIGYSMKDLPCGGQGNRDMNVEGRKLVTDVEYSEVKVTVAGEVINWHPLAKRPYKNKGQSLWAKMTDANMASTAFRGALKSVGKLDTVGRRALRSMGKGSLDKGGAGEFSLQSIGKDVLDEIKMEDELNKDKLSDALVGFTTAKDDNAKVDTGESHEIDVKKTLLSALKKPKASGQGNGANDAAAAAAQKDGSSKKKKGFLGFLPSIVKGKKPESEKKVVIQDETVTGKKAETSSATGARALRRSRQSRGSKEMGESAEEWGSDFDGSKGAGESQGDDDSKSQDSSKKKSRFSIAGLRNHFKNSKKEEEMAKQEAAKQLVYGESTEEADEIVKSAKLQREREERPWEHPREQPVDTARVYLTLALHAPSLISEKKVTEKMEDGNKVTKTVIDGSKRRRWEKKIMKELAEIAGVPIKHVTIDEVVNRDTQVGYFHGSKYVIGKDGEFKSAQEKHVEFEEQLEKERVERKSRRSSLTMLAKEKLSALQHGKADAVKSEGPTEDKEKEKEKSKDRSSPSQQLPRVATPKDKVRRGAQMKRKRDLINEMAMRNTSGTGSRWSLNDARHNDSEKISKKRLRRASSAADLNINVTEKLVAETERVVLAYSKNSNGAYREDSKASSTRDLKDVPNAAVAKIQKCFPKSGGSGSAAEGGALALALKSRGSEHHRCNIVATFSACGETTALMSAIKVVESTKKGTEVAFNGIVSNCVKSRAEASGQRRFFEEWEHYWCSFITPVFFGYSTISKFKTKTKHKIILGPQKVKKPKNKLTEFENDYERTCVEYKRRFARGEVAEDHWTPEQFQAHTARERAKFKLDLYQNHLRRVERKAALERSPEPWMRPRKKPTPFTSEQVEKWERKFHRKEVKERKKQRQKNKEIRIKNEALMKQRVWDKKVEHWFRGKLLSYNSNKEKIAQKMESILKEEEEAHFKFVVEETDELKIGEYFSSEGLARFCSRAVFAILFSACLARSREVCRTSSS